MWLNPPDNLILSSDEAHIWRARLDLDDSYQHSFLQLLSPDEKTRASKFRFPRDSRNYIVARGILRTLIGQYLEMPPQEISFQYSKFGKPTLEGIDSLQFNISHAKNVALFAFTKKFTVGVDVEYVNPEIEVNDIARSFFATKEVSNLLALPEEQQPLAFFNCWTRKEAFIKAIGEGLSFPLNQFEVSLAPDEPAELLATHWDVNAVSNWTLHSMSPAPDFVGCLVIKGSANQVKFWNWDRPLMF